MNKIAVTVIHSVLLLTIFGYASAQQRSGPKITHSELVLLQKQCAPTIPIATLEAVARTESGMNPYALSVNYPHRLAKRYGYTSGTIGLYSQPTTKSQAIQWALFLLQHDVTVSAGLLQINVENLPLVDLSLEEVFDPCKNLKAGGRILTTDYQKMVAEHGLGLKSFFAALALFNSGSETDPVYVYEILKHVHVVNQPKQKPDLTASVPHVRAKGQ
jgi:type IV secretion system protein VirB1